MSVVEAGIQASAVEASACPLCSATSSHGEHDTPAAVDRRDGLLPWAVGLTAAVIIASVGIGSDRWLGIGAVAGLSAGAVLAWRSVRTAVRARQSEHELAVQSLNDDADDRVAMVIRQFEWAVNDVAHLRRERERAQVTADLLIVQGRAREKHIRKLEREILEAREREAVLAASARSSERAEFEPSADERPSTVRVRWGLHYEGGSPRLELECDGRTYRPTRLRVVGPDGEVHTSSMLPMHSGDGALCFALAEPPALLIADLVAGLEPSYRLEGQYDYEWRPVLLEDSGRRTRMMNDKQGRQFRVTDAPEFKPRPTVTHFDNPFDLTADSAFFTL